MGFLSRFAKRSEKRLGDGSGLPERAYPAPDDLEEHFNTEYKGRDGNTLTADIYRMKDAPADKLPVIILIHGGGLFSGHPVMERGACEALARKGYLVFCPSYRMLNDTDIFGEMRDICSAYDHALSVLGEYGGDSGRMYVIAESAAACLALYASAVSGSEKLSRLSGCAPSEADIRAIAFVSGMFYTARRDVIGLTYPREIYGALRKDPEFRPYMDPENAEVINSLPPSILTSSRNDFLRKYTLSYAEALEKAGADHQLIYYPEKNRELRHAFVTLHTELPESAEALEKIHRWFGRC